MVSTHVWYIILATVSGRLRLCISGTTRNVRVKDFTTSCIYFDVFIFSIYYTIAAGCFHQQPHWEKVSCIEPNTVQTLTVTFSNYEVYPLTVCCAIYRGYPKGSIGMVSPSRHSPMSPLAKVFNCPVLLLVRAETEVHNKFNVSYYLVCCINRGLSLHLWMANQDAQPLFRETFG